VATNTTGMSEILRSGDDGVIVPLQDEPALLAAIRELVDRPDLRALRARVAGQVRNASSRRAT
jgi:glycosyltransferase involved in cell wall biosynthesis